QQKQQWAKARPITLQAYSLKTPQHHDRVVEGRIPYTSTQIHTRQTSDRVKGLAACRQMFPDWCCLGKHRCRWRQALPGIRDPLTASQPQQDHAETKGAADQAHHVTLPPSGHGRYAVSAPQQYYQALRSAIFPRLAGPRADGGDESTHPLD